MGRYKFENSEYKGYVIIHDGMMQMPVAEICAEAAMVISLMYENMLKQNERMADELVYGYILGMTHGMMFRDKNMHVQRLRIKACADFARSHEQYSHEIEPVELSPEQIKRMMQDADALTSSPPRSRAHDIDHLRDRSLDGIPKNALHEDGSPIVNLGTQNNEGDS